MLIHNAKQVGVMNYLNELKNNFENNKAFDLYCLRVYIGRKNNEL